MINKNTIISAFNQQAKTYDAHAVLGHEVGERLFEQLQFMRITPSKILDLGAGTGYFSQQLIKQYPQATAISIDIAEKMCSQSKNPLTLCGDAEELPLKANTIDLVFANLLLPWCPDIPQTLQEIQRVLKPGGLLLFTTFGPDTLKGIGKYDFNDMHDIGDLLVQLKFTDPVMNMEHLTFTYTHINTLNTDLKNWCLAQGQGLPFVATHSFLQNKLAPIPFPLTFEIIYGHAWVGEKNIATINKNGEVLVPISNIKRKLD